MAFVILTLTVVVIGFVCVFQLRRLTREAREDQPEWTAEWKRTSRAKKRHIARALRRGETPYNPDDARLLIGLSRHTEVVQRRNLRWSRWHLPFAAVGLVLAVITGNVGLAVAVLPAAAGALVLQYVALPRMQARHHRAVAAAKHFHAPSDRSGRAARPGFTPSAESRPGTSRAPAP
jgi:hypothetical protein